MRKLANWFVFDGQWSLASARWPYTSLERTTNEREVRQVHWLVPLANTDDGDTQQVDNTNIYRLRCMVVFQNRPPSVLDIRAKQNRSVRRLRLKRKSNWKGHTFRRMVISLWCARPVISNHTDSPNDIFYCCSKLFFCWSSQILSTRATDLTFWRKVIKL